MVPGLKMPGTVPGNEPAPCPACCLPTNPSHCCSIQRKRWKTVLRQVCASILYHLYISCPVSMWTLIQGKLGLGPLCRTGITGCYKATCRDQQPLSQQPCWSWNWGWDRSTAAAAGPESPYCHVIITCPTFPGPGSLRGPGGPQHPWTPWPDPTALEQCWAVGASLWQPQEWDSSDRGS